MSILIMILLLSLLILVHEAGHFLAARAYGVRVDRFGFGLPVGPTLFAKKFGETEVVVHAFLLGGYVSFPDDDKDCDLPEDSEQRFMNKPLWQRAVIVSAGVIANVICAFALVFLVATWTKHLPSGNFEIYTAGISAPKEASIWNSGLQIGDRILSANNCQINNIYSLVTIVKNSAKGNGVITQEIVDKNYEALKALNPGLEKDEIIPKDLSIRLPEKPETDIITMDKYAAKGAKYFKKDGFKLDERLKNLKKEITDKTVYISNGNYSLNDLAMAISDGVHPINLVVLRNGEKINLEPIYPDEKGLIGIALDSKQTLIETNNPKKIIVGSSKYLIDNTYMMVYSLGQLFTGNVPIKDMHGVVAITKIGGDMIEKTGKSAGILLAALISMNLALLNILPIPALDGGHLMFLLIVDVFLKTLKVLSKHFLLSPLYPHQKKNGGVEVPQAMPGFL